MQNFLDSALVLDLPFNTNRQHHRYEAYFHLPDLPRPQLVALFKEYLHVKCEPDELVPLFDCPLQLFRFNIPVDDASLGLAISVPPFHVILSAFDLFGNVFMRALDCGLFSDDVLL